MTAMNPIALRASAVWWKDLERWDVKFFSARVRSSYPVVRLAPLIHEHSERVKPFDFPETTFRILGVTNTGGIFHAYYSLGKKIYQPYQRVDAGDFAYNPYRVNVGSIGVVPAELGGNYISPAYVVFATDKARLLPEYLILVLKADWFNPMVRAATAGSVRQNLTFGLLCTLEIPLPPLAEQKAIVARWRKAQDEIAIACDRLAKLEVKVQSGFLQDLGVNTPSEVIRPKCFAVWWKNVVRFSVNATADGVLGLDVLQSPKYPHFALGDIAGVSYGIQKCPANRPGQHPRPYLRVANVRKGYLDLSEVKTINVPDNEMDTYRLQQDDILFVEGNGSRAELGRVAKWNGEIADCVHQNHLIKVRINQTRLLPDYAMTWFNTEVGRGHFFRAAKTSSGLGTINSSEVRIAPIPLPPLAVQKQIMERVAAGREEIAREREAADRLAREINAEIETLILGT